ncbi:MAG: M23 family metallopeptidase [Acidobacteriota bacterium]
MPERFSQLAALLDRLRGRGGSGRDGSGSSERATAPGKPFLEFQYHPADIRRRVRYLFLTRRQAGWLAAGVVAWTLLLVLGLWLAPEVVRRSLADRRLGAERADLAIRGERLESLVEQLEALESEVGDARLQMAKIHLAYGFDEEPARGKGGFPPGSALQHEGVFGRRLTRAEGLHGRVGEQLGVLKTFLDEVQAFEQSHRDSVAETPSLSPVESENFVLTSPFGMRTSPFTGELDFHPGLDFAAPTGVPILAPADGVVAFAGRYPLKQSVGWWRYGNLLVLRHGDRFITLYGHCDEVKVSGGERVERGQVVATVGNTGWSTAPHLHYEVRRQIDGKGFVPVDPRIYILDHRWRDEERILVRARQAPDTGAYEPLPKRF